MKDTYHLSAAESEIMEKIWAQPEPIKQTQLLALLNSENNKEWGRQTLNTLLIRLEDRGFIRREKHIVHAVYSKEEFGILILKDTIDTYFGGNFKKAIRSLQK